MAATVERASQADREAVQTLIEGLHKSEGMTPRRDRIAYAVEQQLKQRFPGLLLVAREKSAILGLALCVYEPSAELGRVLVVQDFYVVPEQRRKGVGRALVQKILDEAKALRIDRIDLEILPKNVVAPAFWKALGFKTEGRTVFSKILT